MAQNGLFFQELPWTIWCLDDLNGLCTYFVINVEFIKNTFMDVAKCHSHIVYSCSLCVTFRRSIVSSALFVTHATAHWNSSWIYYTCGHQHYWSHYSRSSQPTRSKYWNSSRELTCLSSPRPTSLCPRASCSSLPEGAGGITTVHPLTGPCPKRQTSSAPSRLLRLPSLLTGSQYLPEPSDEVPPITHLRARSHWPQIFGRCPAGHEVPPTMSLSAGSQSRWRQQQLCQAYQKHPQSIELGALEQCHGDNKTIFCYAE